MNKMPTFFQAYVVYTLRTSVVTISLFSHTPLYLLYILFAIVGFFCKDENNVFHFVCKEFIFVLLIVFLLLLVLLNLPATKKRVEGLIGDFFLERYLPGRGKVLFPLSLFILTFSVLNCIEGASVISRMTELGEYTDSIYQQIDSISKEKTPDEVARIIRDVLTRVQKLPYKEYPKTGIITDIGSYLSGSQR